MFTKEVSRYLRDINKDLLIFSPVKHDELPPDCIYSVSRSMKGSKRLSNNLLRFLYINTVLPFLCKQKGLDVLYCPILEFPLIPSVPLVVHVHDLHFIHFPSEFGLATPRLKFSLKMMKRLVKRVVVSSEFVRSELVDQGFFDKEKIDVVPLAYNSRLFRPQTLEMKRDFLSRYSIKGDYILFVGSLFPYKNLETLISAFLKIAGQSEHYLVVIGRREFSSEPLVRNERIIYLDYVPDGDMPLFYSYSSVFVYPSLREGFGIPPLEAMACGTPVISSNRGALPEVVGDAGLLFDPEDSRALSELLLEVINNEGLRRALVEKGLNHVKRFSWEKTAEGILKSCERALAEL